MMVFNKHEDLLDFVCSCVFFHFCPLLKIISPLWDNKYFRLRLLIGCRRAVVPGGVVEVLI